MADLVTIKKPKHGSMAWLKLRHRDAEGRVVFGASDAPALMNASPFKTRGDLFANKVSEPREEPSNPVFDRGNFLEPALITYASAQLGIKIATPKLMYQRGRFTVSPDGLDDPTNPSVCIEAKTTTRYSIQDTDDLMNARDYVWQGYALQYAIGVPVIFVTLDRNQRLSVLSLPSNPAAISALKTEAEIFAEAIESGLPAEEDIEAFSADQITAIYKAQPTSVELPREALDYVLMLEDANRLSKEASAAASTAKDALARMLLGNEIGTLGGHKIISWKEQAGRKSFDAKKFAEDNPTLYDNYSSAGNPFRVMRIHTKS